MTLRLLQLTDLHLFEEPDGELKGIPTARTLADVLAHIDANEAPFDHLVITGDHTHDELEPTYRRIRTIVEPWLDRLHIVPGNHDDRGLLRSVFPELTSGDGRLTFRFEAGGWLFLGLDSHLVGEVHGELGAEQLNWFEQQLSQACGPVGVFLHHPPCSVNSTWMDSISLSDEAAVRQLISQNPVIRFVCCGHVHHEFAGKIAETAVFTTPSTGIQFDPNGDQPTFAATAPGYRVFEFDGPEFRTHVVKLPEVRFVPNV